MFTRFRNVVSFVILQGAMFSSALAQDAGGAAPQQPSFGSAFFDMLPMFVMVFFVFYFMVIRPQEKRIRSQEQLLKSLKKGSQVVTSGGVIGRVAGIEKDYILLEISNNVKIRIEAGHISKLFEKAEVETRSVEKSKKKGKSAA